MASFKPASSFEGNNKERSKGCTGAVDLGLKKTAWTLRSTYNGQEGRRLRHHGRKGGGAGTGEEGRRCQHKGKKAAPAPATREGRRMLQRWWDAVRWGRLEGTVGGTGTVAHKERRRRSHKVDLHQQDQQPTEWCIDH
ncbi:hypothetical protein OsI_12354 [Oryza sativa Indica Group]|uniref:Uncharacterized protein n=1 Tax=Oryza sativa subsp. indica TaxID=39946 RepID=A2XIU2_ORYSI|nr:hypothetical protein OsI_12354 [Oryza sativa Indica Group]